MLDLPRSGVHRTPLFALGTEICKIACPLSNGFTCIQTNAISDVTGVAAPSLLPRSFEYSQSERNIAGSASDFSKGLVGHSKRKQSENVVLASRVGPLLHRVCQARKRTPIRKQLEEYHETAARVSLDLIERCATSHRTVQSNTITLFSDVIDVLRSTWRSYARHACCCHENLDPRYEPPSTLGRR